jgi:hypothetical protein
MYQTGLPPWPDAQSAEAANGAVITADQLMRLGEGDRNAGLRQLRLIIACESERKVSKGPIVKPGNVRLAGPDDEAAILSRLLEDVSENAAHIAPPSEAHIRAYIDTQSRRSVVGVIDGDDGRPAAICVLVGAQWWWSDHWYLMEVCNYVHPDHRRSSYIDDMIDFERWLSDQWSEQYGYRVYLVAGVMGTRRLRAKIALYWRRMTEVGRAYLYPPPPPFRSYH